MTSASRRILSHFAALVPPGLVLLLLGIQVAFGLRGFDKPDESLLYVLQMPGILLGWGGVALLVPLLAWMIMDWWGYDLNGFALKGLGSAVLGIAFGALVGIGGGVAGGGLVGAGLATLLVDALGTGFAVVLLIVMVGPAGVLALSMQRTPAPAAAVPTEVETPAPVSRPASPQTTTRSTAPRRRFSLRLLPFPRFRRPTREDEQLSRAWYPERRYDAEGNELPPAFDRTRDAGTIRFADEQESEEDEIADVEPVATPEAEAEHEAVLEEDVEAEHDADVEDDDEDTVEDRVEDTVEEGAVDVAEVPEEPDEDDEERLPTIPELLSGRFDRSRLVDTDAWPEGFSPAEGLDEEREAEPVDDGAPLHVDSEGRPIQPPEPPVRPAPPPREAPAQLTFVSMDRSRPPAEPSLPAGVRWADDTPEPEPDSEADAEAQEGAAGAVEANGHLPASDESTSSTHSLPQSVRDAVRGPAPSTDATPATSAIGSMRASLRDSFESIQTPDASDRYLAKLEASGIFDDIKPVHVQSEDQDEDHELEPAAVAAPESAHTEATSSRSANRKRSPSKRTAKKRTTPKKKKATAKKKAASKKKATSKKKAIAKKKAASKKKAAAKKRATPSRKKASSKKKATPKKKAAAKKKAAGKRKVTRSAAPPAPKAARVDPAILARRHLLAGIRKERTDPLFVRAVEAAMERGAATPVLYTRRLGLPYERAQAMVDRLVDVGVLGRPARGGAHPLQLSKEDWAATS